MKTKYAQVIQDSEIRARLWREFVSNYRRVLATEPEKFTQYAEKFRHQYLQVR
jgi:hypothetical protein